MLDQIEILARVDALLPALAGRAAEADDVGAVADADVAAWADAGILATLAPKTYGGLELGFDTFSQIVQRVSAVSPSAGWVCSFLMGASWRLLTLGSEGQEEVFGDRNYVLGAGTAAPIFDVEKVDGGYLISGRTAWNSGASHAQWFQMNGLLKTTSGPPQMMMFVLPRSDVTVLDTWHILGMKGTASRDLVVENTFVPDRRAAPFSPALEGKSHGHRLHANPMYHLPFLPFAMIEVLPVVVGTHRGAANALKDRVIARMGTLSGAKAAERVPSQIRMAQGLARASMAEQMLGAMVTELSRVAPDIAQPMRRAETKLMASMVTNFCLDSVNEMAKSVGGDAFRDGAPFQGYFRDINTVARHAFLDPDTASETYGKMLLGLPASDTLV